MESDVIGNCRRPIDPQIAEDEPARIELNENRFECRAHTELIDRILGFLDTYNREARPFEWTYSGKPLVAGIN